MNSDKSMPAPAPEQELAERLQSKIISVDGVERLHPTIRYAVASITAGNLRAASSTLGKIIGPGSPGVDVYRQADRFVDVTVDLSTDPTRDALAICREIRVIITAEVRASGYRLGRLTVTVRG